MRPAGFVYARLGQKKKKKKPVQPILMTIMTMMTDNIDQELIWRVSLY